MKSEKAAKAKVAKAQEAKVAKKQADAEPTGTKTEPVIVSFRVALTSMSIADFDSAKADKFKVLMPGSRFLIALNSLLSNSQNKETVFGKIM